MATTEAQRRANSNYRKRNVKTHTLSFYPDDADIYAWFCKQDNKTAYLRSLIRKDMQAHGQNEQH